MNSPRCQEDTITLLLRRLLYLWLLGVAVLGDDGELLPVEVAAAVVDAALPRGECRHRRGGVGDLTWRNKYE